MQRGAGVHATAAHQVKEQMQGDHACVSSEHPLAHKRLAHCVPRPPRPPIHRCAQFERDEIEEEELFRIFFADGRPVDGAALKQHMVS